MNTVDIAHLKTWVGLEQRQQETLHAFPARAMAGLLDHESPPVDGAWLPFPWHWLYFLETPNSAATGADGHPRKGGFLPPVPLPRRMWAAGSMTLEHPLRIGESAEKTSTIRSVESKEGKTGDMVFVEIEHCISQQGRHCIRELQTLVYRDMPTGGVPLPDGERAIQTADWSRQCSLDSVMLFRFSALTYNAHRIHYDREYATQEEFYPGLVAHAPLLVTLLLSLLLCNEPEFPLRRLRFRAIRPTFDVAAITLSGKRDGNEVSLWSADQQNFIGLKAAGSTVST